MKTINKIHRWFNRKIFTGTCICGHSYEDHHGNFVLTTKIVSPKDMRGMLFGECEIGEVNGEPTGEKLCWCNSYIDKGWIFLRFKKWQQKLFAAKKPIHIPFGQYCYTPQYYDRGIYHIIPCPYYWHNPLGIGDCSFLSPKWKFWKWNGWSDYDPALDDQCKACDIHVDYEDNIVSTTDK